MGTKLQRPQRGGPGACDMPCVPRADSKTQTAEHVVVRPGRGQTPEVPDTPEQQE